MLLDEEKCSLFNIHIGTFRLTVNIRINGKVRDAKQNIKYLGVTYDINLIFEPHTIKIKNKLHTYIRRTTYILNNVKSLIYYFCIHSRLNYLAPIWGNTNRTALQRIQNKAVKLIYNFKKLTATKDLQHYQITDYWQNNFFRVNKIYP